MPVNVRITNSEEIRSHEELTKANVRFGSYDMDQLSPPGDFQFFHCQLCDVDLERLFLLWEQTFIPHTRNNSCKLADMLPTVASMTLARRPSSVQKPPNLAKDVGMEPVLVTTDILHGPLITIDGNHRLADHYAHHHHIEGIKVFVGVHWRILDWMFIPPLAKRYLG